MNDSEKRELLRQHSLKVLLSRKLRSTQAKLKAAYPALGPSNRHPFDVRPSQPDDTANRALGLQLRLKQLQRKGLRLPLPGAVRPPPVS